MTMGNQGSFMEKVYVYLPVLMCHSKMDYTDKTTMWNIRAAYFAEQASTTTHNSKHTPLLLYPVVVPVTNGNIEGTARVLYHCNTAV